MKLALFLVAPFLLLASSVHATYWVYADGASDFGLGGYSEYLENSKLAVSGGKSRSTFLPSGTLGSTASIGSLQAYSTVSGYGNPFGYRNWSRAQFLDVLTVAGSGPVTLRLTLKATGSLTQGSQDALGLANLSLINVTGNDSLELSYRTHMSYGVETVDRDSRVGEFTVNPGDSLRLSGYLVTDSRVSATNLVLYSSGASYSLGSEASIEILTPGASINSQSGHNYTPVPEASSMIVLAGLSGILLRRRQKS